MSITLINILVLDASTQHTEQLIDLLRSYSVAAKVTRLESPQQAQQLLKQDLDWDLWLCDGQHPQLTATHVKDLLEQHDINIPLIYIFDEINEEQLEQASSLGATRWVYRAHPLSFVQALNQELLFSRKQSELTTQKQTLVELQKRVTHLIDEHKDPTAIVVEGIIHDANRKFSDALGSPEPASIIGTPLLDFIAEEQQQAFKKQLRSLGQHGRHTMTLQLRGSSDSSAPQTRIAIITAQTVDGEPAIQLQFAPEETLQSNTAYQGSQSLTDNLRKVIEPEQGVLLLIDVDKVAQLRSNIGFHRAAQVLEKIPPLITQQCRESWFTAPYSASTVVVYAKDLSLASARKIAEQILKHIENAVITVDQRTAQCTCSIGIASTQANQTTEMLLDNAYRAMQECRAEQSGNGYRLYTADTKAGVAGNTGMTLDDAIALHRFRLSFQPLVSIDNSEGDLYEVYLRMLDQNDEEISPSQFIEAFTAKEFTTKLDRWVILETLKRLNEVIKENPDVKVIINLTANALHDDKLIPWISLAIKAAEISPSRVVFQFLEANLHTYLIRAASTTESLYKLGCEVAITRFGEHAEPMKLLNRVQTSYVKIAPHYMRYMDDGNEKPIKDILKKVKDSGCKSIVGYVESAANMAKLWQFEVALIQGYYIAQPTPEMTFEFSDF